MNTSTIQTHSGLDTLILRKAYYLMCIAQAMDQLYEEQRVVTHPYTYSTSRGHEAIQLAMGLQLKPYDYLAPYYRDDTLLLGLGLRPYELMLQLLAKGEDTSSGGRGGYARPVLKQNGLPTIPYLSEAAGAHIIPATGMAQGIAYQKSQQLTDNAEKSIVVCSMGDGAITKGEAAEAFQIAILKKLPIIYLVQDNDWCLSAKAEEIRAMDAYEYASGFRGMKRVRVNGADFVQAYEHVQQAIEYVRQEQGPILLHAKCPLLGNHSSSIRKEWYRGEDNIYLHSKDDPFIRFDKYLLLAGETEKSIHEIKQEAKVFVRDEFTKAMAASAPGTDTCMHHIFAPATIIEEKGQRSPEESETLSVAEAASHAIDEILKKHPEALFYGQDIGGSFGGVFREAALLATRYTNSRVFNMPLHESYIIGSTAGLAAIGCKPIIEIRSADHIWTGLNQLVHGLSRSNYLSNGKFPVQTLIRIPVGAYGGGGTVQSASIESVLLQISGIKVVYPSNAADMKGLMKSAFLDPNPVIMLEHKGLYWSTLAGTESAKTPEPDESYIIPLGKARIVQQAAVEKMEEGASVAVITYGMGVYWALAASSAFPGAVEILDLRTLCPLDWEEIIACVKRHNKVLIVTEEPLNNSFAEALAGRITKACFKILDAPVSTCGALPVPAIPMNMELEKTILPNPEKIESMLKELLNY